MSCITRPTVPVKLLALLIWLCAIARGGDFDPPVPKITLLKPAHKLEVAAGSQAELGMLGTNLELFRYGQVELDKRKIRSFRVRLAEPSRDGTLRTLLVEADSDTEPGLYELRLFTSQTSLDVVQVQVVHP